ncbi:MAG: DUF5317 family protein [Acidobacteria bacterium]|nr:DUF5317 family protein [Acidobacteriota bacterium]
MFALLLLTLAPSVAVGLAMGGRLANLKLVSLRASPVLFAGLVLGLAPLFADLSRGAGRALVIGSNLLVAAFLALNVPRNRGAVRLGLLVIALGWLLNMSAIVANEGMPLSRWAYARSGQTGEIAEGEGDFFKIVIADERTRLRALGDVIPIRALGQVVSLGDIALALGIGVVVAGGMRSRGEAPVDEAAPTG